MLILPFTDEVAQRSPEEFVEQILVQKARGSRRGGGRKFPLRAQEGRETRASWRHWVSAYGFSTEIVPAVSCRGATVSQQRPAPAGRGGRRRARAARLLTCPYALEGEVVAGHGVGKQKTVPTLNLATQSEVLPKRGVYVTRTTDLEDNRSWESVTNIGYRPTFGGSHQLSIETFLLDPLAGETPRAIRVEFLWRLRDERKFESPEALKTQILKDVGRARAYFRRLNRWKRPPVLEYI